MTQVPDNYKAALPDTLKPYLNGAKIPGTDVTARIVYANNPVWDSATEDYKPGPAIVHVYLTGDGQSPASTVQIPADQLSSPESFSNLLKTAQPVQSSGGSQFGNTIKGGLSDIAGVAKGFKNNVLDNHNFWKAVGAFAATAAGGSALVNSGFGQAGAAGASAATTGAGGGAPVVDGLSSVPGAGASGLTGGAGAPVVNGIGTAAPVTDLGSTVAGGGSNTITSGFGSFLAKNSGSLASAGIMAGAGILSGNKAADAANNATAAQSAIMDKSLALQAQQEADAKQLGQEQIDLSKQQFQHSLDVGQKLEDNASLAPGYIDQQTAQAGLTAKQTDAAALDASKRNLTRMGVDPSSGRYAGDMRVAELGDAGNQIGAMNNTRAGLTNYAKSLKAQALSAEMGISNPAIQATGQQSSNAIQEAGLTGNMGANYAGIYGNTANVANTNAMNAYTGGLTAAGTILGRTLQPAPYQYAA